MSEDSKRKEQERLRKQHQRAKKRAIEEGNYVFTPIEKAKKLLEEMPEVSLDEIYLNNEIAAQLTVDDRRPLQNFVNYLKQKRKREQEEEKKRQDQEQQISEKGRSFGNQKTYDLQQQLLMPMQEEERAREIKSVIDTNLFLFLEYMEAYQPPFNDFLKIVVGLQGQVDKSSFTELFVRVCTYQKIEDLKVSQEMVLDAIGFLVNKKKDEKAAYGLLRLIYCNSISLSGFPHGFLIKFQADYEQTILRFFKSIPSLETQVAESLPATTFCFTSPIIKSLKDGGKVFFTQIPYRFMPFVIQIVCFSFTESTASFDKFLTTFRDGMKEHYNILLQNKFTELLQRILDDCIAMNKKCFGSLDMATIILQRAFQLLKQRKFELFSSTVIASLVDGDDEAIQLMSQRPSIIPQNSQMKISQVFKEFQKLNPNLDIEEAEVCLDLSAEGQSHFQASGIDVPLPIQIMCYNLCTHFQGQARFMVHLDTGMGKTALCLSIAYFFASQGRKVAILNYSEDLCFRDFKKAEARQNDHGIKIFYKNNQNVGGWFSDGITFTTFNFLLQIIFDGPKEEKNQLVLIADELDSAIFCKSQTLQEVQRMLATSEKLVGFTGSDLKDCHMKAIEKVINGQIVRMNVKNLFMPQAVCHGIEVIDKIGDFRDIIVSLCSQEALKTPIIIIADDQQRFLEKKLQKAGIFVEALHNKTIFDSNALMINFNRKSSEKYPVFIINESQGRGLDFQTSPDIEDKGGIYLLIATLPSSFLQYKQFLGRTGRMGNKAQFSVILLDKESKNEDGKSYLEKKLGALYNQDLAYINSWIQLPDEEAQIIMEDQPSDKRLEHEQIISEPQISQAVQISIENEGENTQNNQN